MVGTSVGVGQKIFDYDYQTPTSPFIPFRAKFRPLRLLFLPSHPLAYSLSLLTCSP